MTSSHIILDSRCDVASENEEMANFVKVAEIMDVAKYVHKLFYNSKSNLCSIELSISDSDPDYFYIVDAILGAAKTSISQFALAETIHHGHPMEYEYRGKDGLIFSPFNRSTEVKKSEDAFSFVTKEWGERGLALCQLADNIGVLILAIERDLDHNEGKDLDRLIQIIKAIIAPHIPNRGE